MPRRTLALAALLAGGALVVINTTAQPVRREILKDLRIEERGGCQAITTEFPFAVALEGRTPVNRGELLSVHVTPVHAPEIATEFLAGREALVPAEELATPLESVVWEGDAPEGPQLLLRFDHPVSYEVSVGRDARSVVVLVLPETTDPAPCQDGAMPMAAGQP